MGEDKSLPLRCLAEVLCLSLPNNVNSVSIYDMVNESIHSLVVPPPPYRASPFRWASSS
uniref:Uncharacterized protein n=1 Tax=Daphnia magna TaxID=35525 RepID=A0A0P6CHH2_9CRUS